MVLAFGDSANWTEFYTNTFNRNYTAPVTDSDYGQIGEIVLPVTFSSPYLVVTASTSTGKPNWKQLGYVKQKITTIHGTIDTYINQRFLLSLSQPTLLTFDASYASSYALWFRPFNWFNDVTINVYQYTGSLT